MIDVVGLKLEKAQKILQSNGLNWEIEITKAPRFHLSGEHGYNKRIVRQKELTSETFLLTVVYQVTKTTN